MHLRQVRSTAAVETTDRAQAAVEPIRCTEGPSEAETSEHPFAASDLLPEFIEVDFDFSAEPGDQEDFLEEIRHLEDVVGTPDLYEPSESFPDQVYNPPVDSPKDPIDQNSWKRYATSEWVTSEVKRVKQAGLMDLRSSFALDGPSQTLSMMFQLPAESIALLQTSPEAEHQSQDSVVANQRLVHARRTRIMRSDDDLRDASIAKLKHIILLDPAASRLGELLVPTSSRPMDEVDIRRSLDQAFSRKSSNTLYKRACALTRYVSWFDRLNHRGSPLRLKEFDIYSYLGHLESERAGPTAASGFIEALRFLDSVAVLTFANLDLVLSPRVTGFAYQQYLRKAPLNQKDPIPCLLIAAMERLLMKKIDKIQVCVLGQLLWCFHAASRWSDSLRIQSLKLEKAESASLVTGEALGSKTSVTKEAQTRLLPYAAIGTGVSGEPWAEKWINSRAEELGREPDPFLPAFSCKTGRWSTTPMSSSEATGYLQDFINECLPLPDLKIDLNKIGTHSLKTGLLTMAARSTSIKFSMSERRTLGHHIKPSDRSVLTYSREAFTSLYAKVLACFQQIQAGSFRPDSTALERIMDAATEMVSGLPAHPEVPLPTCEVPDEADPWEVSSESSEEDQALVGVLSNQEEVQGRKPFPSEQEVDCIVHRKSGIVHALQPLGDYTLCGRPVTGNYVELQKADTEDMECCILCGRQLGVAAKSS